MPKRPATQTKNISAHQATKALKPFHAVGWMVSYLLTRLHCLSHGAVGASCLHQIGFTVSLQEKCQAESLLHCCAERLLHPIKNRSMTITKVFEQMWCVDWLRTATFYNQADNRLPANETEEPQIPLSFPTCLLSLVSACK